MCARVRYEYRELLIIVIELGLPETSALRRVAKHAVDRDGESYFQDVGCSPRGWIHMSIIVDVPYASLMSVSDFTSDLGDWLARIDISG